MDTKEIIVKILCGVLLVVSTILLIPFFILGFIPFYSVYLFFRKQTIEIIEARWHIGASSALYNWTMAVRGSNPSKGKDFNINTYINLADLLL